jgi:hypothetical protein
MTEHYLGFKFSPIGAMTLGISILNYSLILYQEILRCWLYVEMLSVELIGYQ